MTGRARWRRINFDELASLVAGTAAAVEQSLPTCCSRGSLKNVQQRGLYCIEPPACGGTMRWKLEGVVALLVLTAGCGSDSSGAGISTGTGTVNPTPGVGAGGGGAAVCAGCRIDGICRVDGELNPSNGCEQCDPRAASNAWSPNADALCSIAPPDRCTDGDERACSGNEQGICRPGTSSCRAGTWSECEGAVSRAARDCVSGADQDCDGKPDDTVDEVCACAVGSQAPCDEHLGLDGIGSCKAGIQDCVAVPEHTSSAWGACRGSIAPVAQDSCLVAGDDADCDGIPNGGCPCVEGAEAACGPPATIGICRRGLSTCVGGIRSECVGAISAQPRDCRSNLDNDCDGVADDAVDSFCICKIGEQGICGEHPGSDGVGRCRAGQRPCIAGPNNTTSRFGECVGSVGPASLDSCAEQGDDSNCDGVSNGNCSCIAGQRSTCQQVYGSLGSCASRALVCSQSGSWPAISACAGTPQELCDNGLDDNCNGQVDETSACLEQDSTIVVDSVVPSSNAAGLPLLIVGHNLDGVTGIRIGGQTAAVTSRDLSVPEHQKLVAIVPNAAGAGSSPLRLVTSNRVSVSRNFTVATLPGGPAAVLGPKNAYDIVSVPDAQFFDPTGTFYPPIDDLWRNECDDVDSYQLLSFGLGAQAPSNFPNGFPGGVFYFQSGDDGDDAIPADGSGPPPPRIAGYIDPTSHLVHMIVGAGRLARSYVGVYSLPKPALGGRIVLFPETSPGRQLVLFVCEADGCDKVERITTANCTR